MHTFDQKAQEYYQEWLMNPDKSYFVPCKPTSIVFTKRVVVEDCYGVPVRTFEIGDRATVTSSGGFYYIVEDYIVYVDEIEIVHDQTQLTDVRKECRALANKLAEAEADRDVARARLEELDDRPDC